MWGIDGDILEGVAASGGGGSVGVRKTRGWPPGLLTCSDRLETFLN